MRHRDFSRLTAEFLQLCANLTRLVDFADQKKNMAVQKQGTTMHQLSSFRLIACELIMACLFIVSAQVMMLVYGTWTTDMPRSKKILQSDRRNLFTYELKHASSDSCIYAANISPYHHMTIHTHNHALTYIHTYIYTDTHNMNTAHIHHHNITHQNITWRIITSHHMQQDQYIYVCIHLYYYHPTSHHTNIISPHTHIYTYV